MTTLLRASLWRCVGETQVNVTLKLLFSEGHSYHRHCM